MPHIDLGYILTRPFDCIDICVIKFFLIALHCFVTGVKLPTDRLRFETKTLLSFFTDMTSNVLICLSILSMAIFLCQT